MINALLPAVILSAAAAFAGDTQSTTDGAVPPAQLSANEITSFLAARTDVPQNCAVFGDPCSYIICGTPTQPGDWPRGLYACEPD